MEKRKLIDEIRRIAALHHGRPPGRERFQKETGIQISEWYPHLWLRWGDALQEAGFDPNKLNSKLDGAEVLAKYVAFARELGRIPLQAELRVKARDDPTFPSHGVFAKFGSKAALLAAAQEYCTQNSVEDVLPFLRANETPLKQQEAASRPATVQTGYVYLMKSGRHFKIGRTNSVGRREWELGIKIPIPPSTLHVIETDDPVGVELYWHRRFADKRGEGEWFNLVPADVAAFKRWRKIV